MKKYEIILLECDGCSSSIDTVMGPDDYTGDDYIADCDENADPEWCRMLHEAHGVLVLEVDG